MFSKYTAVANIALKLLEAGYKNESILLLQASLRKEKLPEKPLVDVIVEALKRNYGQKRYLKEGERLFHDERVLAPFQGKFHAYTPKQSIYYTNEARSLLQELRTSPLWRETETPNLYVTKKSVGAKDVILVADVSTTHDAPVRLYLSPLSQVSEQDVESDLPDLRGTFPPEYYAVRWIDYGDPMMRPNAYISMMGEYFNLDKEVAKKLTYSDDGADFIYRSSDILDSMVEHKNLPPIPPGHFRFLHTFGLRVTSLKEMWKLANTILKEGLTPQAEGSGAHSELPSAVFGIAALGDSPYRDLLYNPNKPWVTADIPFEELPPYEHPSRSGSVLTLNSVPQKYIVGINGIPIRDFARAMQKWGPANEDR